MIDLNALAREIEEEGRKRREVRRAEGWQFQTYRWWERETGREPAKTTNFCHFWRVLLIWAPLLKFRLQFRRSRLFRWSFIVAITAMFIWLTALYGVQSVMIVTLGVAYAVVGLVLTGMIRHDELDQSSSPSDQVKQRFRRTKLLFAPLYTVVWTVSIVWMSRPARWVRENGAWLLLGGFGLALLAIAIGMIVTEGWGMFLSALGTVVLVIAAGATIAWIISLFESAAKRRRGRRLAAERAQQDEARMAYFAWLNSSEVVAHLQLMYEPLLRNLFAEYHAEKVNDSEAFYTWRKRFEARMNRWKDGLYDGRNYSSFYGTLYDRGLSSWYCRDRAQVRFFHEFNRDYTNQRIDTDPRQVFDVVNVQPGRMRRVKRELVDLAYVIYNIGRVNKWKMCPIMKFEEV